jgi:hypothetical protein
MIKWGYGNMGSGVSALTLRSKTDTFIELGENLSLRLRGLCVDDERFLTHNGHLDDVI